MKVKRFLVARMFRLNNLIGRFGDSITGLSERLDGATERLAVRLGIGDAGELITADAHGEGWE